jgi:hypothetical protein
MSLTEMTPRKPADMSDAEIDAMGPIDYVIIEFPHRTGPGEGLPMLLDLVDRGIIRVLDMAFLRRENDDTVRRVPLAELGPDLAVFEGAASGLLDDGDVYDAARAIEPDSAAAIIVYENHWAAPLAREMRRGGGQLIATGRLPVQGILAALDATETPVSSEGR